MILPIRPGSNGTGSSGRLFLKGALRCSPISLLLSTDPARLIVSGQTIKRRTMQSTSRNRYDFSPRLQKRRERKSPFISCKTQYYIAQWSRFQIFQFPIDKHVFIRSYKGQGTSVQELIADLVHLDTAVCLCHSTYIYIQYARQITYQYRLDTKLYRLPLDTVRCSLSPEIS